jgi:2,4-dienoyl-CoA reductase (NADPH2)
MGRALQADPDLPNKIARGREKDIRPCIHCNHCIETLSWADGVVCVVNPALGREQEFEIKKAAKPKKVIIIGGGPAGMEAARVAALAGHEVHLYEKRSSLGGQLLVAGAPPGRHEFLTLAEYYQAVLPKAGVKVHLGKEVNEKSIAKMKPDAVIVAEGAVPMIPNIPGVDQRLVITSWDFLENNPPIGKRVAVIGGGAVGLETAVLAAKKGTINAQMLEFLMFQRAESDEKLHELICKGTKEVTVFEMLPRVGQDIGKSSRWVLLNELKEYGVRTITNAKVEAIQPDGILYEQEGTKKKECFDTVILAVGSAPQRKLMDGLTRATISYKSVGDCNAPRKIIDAVHEGYLAAIDLR